MTQIAQTLTRLFDRHRIVFWYDERGELTADYDALDLRDVEKIRLQNNEFGVKVRILRQEPAQKFLLYSAAPRPEKTKNWLLDLELAYVIFSADQAALWLTDLGLGSELGEVVRDHMAFYYRSPRRLETLAALLTPRDSVSQIRLKMLAVCAGSEPRLDEILEALLAELAEADDSRQRLIARSQLDGFLWQQVAQVYAYAPQESPSLRDFLLLLLRTGYVHGLAGEPGTLGHGPRLNGEALLFLRRWKESHRHLDTFATLSAQAAKDLEIEDDLSRRPYDELLTLDLFELIDRRILSGLVAGVANHTLSATACEQILRQRRRSRWYTHYEHIYLAIGAAAHLLQAIETADLRISSLAQGAQQYRQQWYGVDQQYRHFVYHSEKSGQTNLLKPLGDQVENRYTNSFLLPLNDAWQVHVDGADKWPPVAALGVHLLAQSEFFEEQVRKPFLTQGNKVFVIISDALRYEVGEELLSRIRQEDRYEGALRPALTLLPSYTQLGMAALLPHQELAINPDDGTVTVDGASSVGTENRAKILERAVPKRATAIQAERLLTMSRDESRDLAKAHDVIYVYQNRIDSVGDKRDSEQRVFEAVEDALDELILIIKKLASANANNMLITADHGFLYQHRPLAESDFAAGSPSGSEILHKNRRYVFGRGLRADASFKHFRAEQMGLAGDTEMLLPKSINRLRQQGSGSRYVHGGASLQEVIVPVLQISKKRQSDVSQVDVDVLQSQSSTITTGQLAVILYQTQAVSDKIQPRPLRIGLYSPDGRLISDRHEFPFDLESAHPQEREVRVVLMLSKQAEAVNNQQVVLRLEVQVEGTSQYTTYRSVNYLLRRSFTSDFDF